MDMSLLKELSEADAIAASEQEVRDILLRHARGCAKEIRFDGLGSVLMRLNDATGPKIMVCAHMDEVGFMVRSISREGAIDVIPVGNVRMTARTLQPVRITTRNGTKIMGLLDGDNHQGNISNLRVDIGAISAEEVESSGIHPGDRVTFATPFSELPNGRIMGKAFDDRLGCWHLLMLLQALHNHPLNAEIWLVATSSEEVGVRGGQTATRMLNPDLALVLDTACWSTNFDYGNANHRQTGRGPMLVMYDKTLIPSPLLTQLVEDAANALGIPLQLDMFSNGGTDGGSIHLSGYGIPTVVLGPPTRHGHCAASIADCRDLEHTHQLLIAMLSRLDTSTVKRLKDFSR